MHGLARAIASRMHKAWNGISRGHNSDQRFEDTVSIIQLVCHRYWSLSPLALQETGTLHTRLSHAHNWFNISFSFTRDRDIVYHMSIQ